MPTRIEKVAKNFSGKEIDEKSGIYGKYRQLLRDSPWRWVIIFASMLYLLSPIDLIPDFIPFIGLVDDGVVAVILVHEVVLMILDGVAKRRAAKASPETQPLLPGPGASSFQKGISQKPGASMYTSTKRSVHELNARPAPAASIINLTS